ncbi:MAG: NAD(P)/FAD-dependent oxidoreductase, partial [Candidatus Hodarchaeota archaeon]
MEIKMYDVAVVGSGPSGSIAGYWCAKQGLKTCILEKEQLPRDKPCGGGLSKKALSYLPFSIPESIFQREGRGITVYIGDHDPFNLGLDEAIGYLTIRRELDYFLTNQAVNAGAELFEQTEVTGLKSYVNGVTLKTKANSDFKAKIVIGADGIRTKIGKLTGLRPKWPTNQIGYCVKANVPFPKEKIEQTIFPSNHIHLFMGFEPDFHGYIWVFPNRDHCNIGIGDMSKNVLSRKRG